MKILCFLLSGIGVIALLILANHYLGIFHTWRKKIRYVIQDHNEPERTHYALYYSGQDTNERVKLLAARVVELEKKSAHLDSKIASVVDWVMATFDKKGKGK
jgi:hypothetical protein